MAHMLNRLAFTYSNLITIKLLEDLIFASFLFHVHNMGGKLYAYTISQNNPK